MNRTGREGIKGKHYHWALFKNEKSKPHKYLRNLPCILKEGPNEGEPGSSDIAALHSIRG